MNYIEKMLAEQCPKGVEWAKLGEVCELRRGMVISKKYLSENRGEYPVYSSQTTNAGEIGRINSFDFDQTAVTWTTDGAYAGTVFFRSGKFSITNVCGLLTLKDSQVLDYKFLYFWLSIEAKKHVNKGMGNPKLMSNKVALIPIPIPPLPIQREIARVLDRLSFCVTELQAALKEELRLRHKQYRYYRDKLLDFSGKPEVEWMKLGEVFELRNGYTPSKKNPSFWEGGTIPWFRMEDIRINGGILRDSVQHITPMAVKGKGLFKANSIILATTATIGVHALIIADSLANQRFTNFSIRKSLEHMLLPKFVYYYFFVIDDWCKRNVNVGTFASVKIDKLIQQPFPIPPLSEQLRIVGILDKFDTLVGSLSEGLPREIELRHKQYEYYRDKLLTFPGKA